MKLAQLKQLKRRQPLKLHQQKLHQLKKLLQQKLLQQLTLLLNKLSNFRIYFGGNQKGVASAMPFCFFVKC